MLGNGPRLRRGGKDLYVVRPIGAIDAQDGNTLRTLGRLDESISASARARVEFLEPFALGVFVSLTLQAAKRSSKALGSLLVLSTGHLHLEEIDRYMRAMRAVQSIWVLDSVEGTERH